MGQLTTNSIYYYLECLTLTSSFVLNILNFIYNICSEKFDGHFLSFFQVKNLLVLIVSVCIYIFTYKYMCLFVCVHLSMYI